MKITVSVLRFGFGLALAMGAVATSALAYTHVVPAAVPEISLGTIGSAATLLSGGYLMLTSRFARKK
jgi:hypothetical protein